MYRIKSISIKYAYLEAYHKLIRCFLLSTQLERYRLETSDIYLRHTRHILLFLIGQDTEYRYRTFFEVSLFHNSVCVDSRNNILSS